MTITSWRRLLLQTARRDFSLAVDKAGSKRAINSAVMAITTISSTKVNPEVPARPSFRRLKTTAISVGRWVVTDSLCYRKYAHFLRRTQEKSFENLL